MAEQDTAGTMAEHEAAPATADHQTAGTEVAHDSGHSAVFPPLNSETFSPQLIWLALTFVVLYVLLARVVLPRIAEVIEERKDRVRRDLDSAEHFKSETDAALSAYEEALSAARQKASGMAKDMRKSLAAETEKERAKTEDQLAGKLAEADKRIADTKAKALTSVNEIAAETASAVVSKLLGDNVSPEDVKEALPSAAK